MNVYISLTSIYQNQSILIKTLQSIVNQTIKPAKCFIYLSEEPYLLDHGFKNKNISSELQSYVDNHNIFEIRWCKNIGPYRKLLPLLKEKFNDDCLIITMDDDIIYHPELVDNLVNDYNKHRCCINYRGFTMKFKKSIMEINYKNRSILKKNNLYNFSTNGAGTIFHPSFFYKTGDLIFNEKIFKECCPTGDDIWYNFCRISNNINCFVDHKKFHLKFNTNKKFALYTKYNSINDRNTKNIKKTIKKLIELGYLYDIQ